MSVFIVFEAFLSVYLVFELVPCGHIGLIRESSSVERLALPGALNGRVLSHLKGMVMLEIVGDVSSIGEIKAFFNVLPHEEVARSLDNRFGPGNRFINLYV